MAAYITSSLAAAGTILFAAAVLKLLQRSTVEPFLIAIGFPSRTARLSSRAIAPVEGITGLALMVGIFPPLFASIAACLSATFAIVLMIAFLRGVEVGCRCFGSIDSNHLSRISLTRSVVLVALSAPPAGRLLAGAPLDPAFWINDTAAWAGVATGITVVVAFALVEQIASFERRRRILFTVQQ